MSVCCWQRAGHAPLYGSEQPGTFPDDLRQGDNCEAVRQTQQTEEPDGDKPGGAENQPGGGVEPLDHTL